MNATLRNGPFLSSESEGTHHNSDVRVPVVCKSMSPKGLAANLSKGENSSSPSKRLAGSSEDSQGDSKKQRADDSRVPEVNVAEASRASILSLGRAWGPDVAVQPSINSGNNTDSVIRQLLQERSMGRSAAPASGNIGDLLREEALLRELSAQQYIQQQAARNAATAQLMSSLSGNQFSPGVGLGGGLSVYELARLQQLQQTSYPMGLDSSLVGHYSNMIGQLPSSRLQELQLLEQLRAQQGNSLGGLANAGSPLNSSTRQDFSPLLQQFRQRSGMPLSSARVIGSSEATPSQGIGGNSEGTSVASGAAGIGQRTVGLPPCEEGNLGPFNTRPFHPLGIDEDPNWLSEFHCFVRSELIEVFRASREDCKARNNAITYQQVGIRCRFCAHLDSSARAGRSSAFPSSLSQIYQSFTMMLRDHFGNCEAMPARTKEQFLALKDKPAQGATDSKRFWVYSATKLGMEDSSKGITVTEQSLAKAVMSPPFATAPGQPWADDKLKNVPLVLSSDQPLVSDFLYLLMSQTQLVHLTEPERIGNRRSLRLGLPGFSCRYCCEHRRLGLCRMFPARRRTLPGKVNDLYDHLRRCSLCPDSVKKQLSLAHRRSNQNMNSPSGGDREFFDRIWNRLGHGASPP